MNDTRRIKFQSPSDPETWTPGERLDDSVFITCLSSGDAKKAEELFNSMLSQLAAKEAELAELRDKLDRYSRRSESGESLGDLFDLADELSQERAKVARLRESITTDRCDGDSDYARGVNDACKRHTEMFKSLDDQAKRDAAVLRAAEQYVAAHDADVDAMKDGDDDVMVVLETRIKLVALCQAVRGEKT